MLSPSQDMDALLATSPSKKHADLTQSDLYT